MVEPKLRNGSYTALVYAGKDDAGKSVYKRITAGTKAEWYIAFGEFKQQNKTAQELRKEKEERGLTVGEAVDRYIDRKDGLRSPTTIAGYRKYRETRFRELMDVYVKDLTKDRLQEAVFAEQKKLSRRGGAVSPKSIKNAFSLILAALSEVSDVKYNIDLPRVHRKIVDLPSASEIIALVRGTDIELPCMLAMWFSFSLSEVRGLTCSSIRRGKIFIDRVKVNVDGVDIVKEAAKVDTRTRAHSIPPYIMGLIEAQDTYREYLATGKDDYLVPLNIAQLRGRFKRLMEKNGYPEMSFHKLRHMNASIMALLGIPDKYAMERGGWKTDHVMKSVYQHTFSAERQAVDAKVDAYFEALLKSEVNND